MRDRMHALAPPRASFCLDRKANCFYEVLRYHFIGGFTGTHGVYGITDYIGQYIFQLANTKSFSTLPSML